MMGTICLDMEKYFELLDENPTMNNILIKPTYSIKWMIENNYRFESIIEITNHYDLRGHTIKMSLQYGRTDILNEYAHIFEKNTRESKHYLQNSMFCANKHFHKNSIKWIVGLNNAEHNQDLLIVLLEFGDKNSVKFMIDLMGDEFITFDVIEHIILNAHFKTIIWFIDVHKEKTLEVFSKNKNNQKFNNRMYSHSSTERKNWMCKNLPFEKKLLPNADDMSLFHTYIEDGFMHVVLNLYKVCGNSKWFEGISKLSNDYHTNVWILENKPSLRTFLEPVETHKIFWNGQFYVIHGKLYLEKSGLTEDQAWDIFNERTKLFIKPRKKPSY